MTTPPKTILLATDFSNRCDRPLDRAVRLMERWNARLVVLHVLERGRASLFEDERRAEEERLRTAVLSEIGDRAGEIETRLARGDVADSVASVAAETAADLIVTGVARMDEFGDFVLGNTVDRLVRHSPAPVLVVKKRARAPYDDIVVATDFSDCSATALRTAAAMFPTARLHLVHAYHVPFEGMISKEPNQAAFEKEHLVEMKRFLADAALPQAVTERLTPHVVYGETGSVVHTVVTTTRAGLAVIGTHGRTGFIANMIGSIAEALLSTLDCDVLAVRSR
jgi:nucleotide-binding universal stress UspA family protein